MATYAIEFSHALTAINTESRITTRNSVGDKVLFKQEGVMVTVTSNQEEPMIVRRRHKVLFLYGTPTFILDQYSPDAVSDLICSDRFSAYDQLDSSFLMVVLDMEEKSVNVVTDRFNSRLAYIYHRGDQLVISTELTCCKSVVSSITNVSVDDSAILEFLWFRRLFGQKTYYENIEVVPPATRLVFRNQKKSYSRYWAYEHSKTTDGMEDIEARMSDSIIAGVNYSLQKNARNGLMLSGGLDSRGMLAIGQQEYIAITNAPSENNEVKIARQLADLTSTEHYFIRRPRNYLTKIFSNAVNASNGSTVYYECQFLGYVDELKHLVDNIHLGLFYDIFFCGHYMPKYQPILFDRNALFFLPQRIDWGNFVDEFMAKVSYRQKQTNLLKIMPIGVYEELGPGMIENIAQVAVDGQRSGLQGESLWEYMHLTNLGRHYSMLMAKSMRPYIDVRIPALTNANYSLALSMPTRKKRNWGVYLRVLKNLCNQSGLMDVPNSNTNIRARYNPFEQSLIKTYKGVRKKILNEKMSVSPSFAERSWPPVSDALMDNDEIRERCRSVIEDGYLTKNRILNKEDLLNIFDETVTGVTDHSIFLNQVITLEYAVLKTI